MTALATTRRLLSVAWPALVLIALWQVWITTARVSPLVAPSPLAVAAELLAHGDLYLAAAAMTAAVAAAGLAGGSLVAVGAALLARLLPFAEGLLTAPALAIQSTPLIAMLPLLARFFGYGESSVIAGTAAITLLPTFVIVGAGLRIAPPGSADLFAVYGASRLDEVRYLALPAAVPNILAALRLAAANSVLAALVSEYLLGQSGLGHVFADAQSSLLTARAWSASLVATALSVGAYAAAQFFERKLMERRR